MFGAKLPNVVIFFHPQGTYVIEGITGFANLIMIHNK
jgi:hypothetical protein